MIENLRELDANLSITDQPDKENLHHYRIDTHGSIPTSVPAFAVWAEFTSTWCRGAFKVLPSEDRGHNAHCLF